jgi:hypothetical protein
VTAFADADEEVKKGRLLTERENPAAHAMVKRIRSALLPLGLGGLQMGLHALDALIP